MTANGTRKAITGTSTGKAATARCRLRRAAANHPTTSTASGATVIVET